MFKIARTVKQIFNVARNVPKSLLSSINGGLKYCSQSKGYVEDASDEFSFLKALPSQSGKTSIQDKFKAIIPNTQNIAEAKSTPLLDSAEIRKLIYARFADEIAKSKIVVESKNLETKSHATREHVETFTTYNIADEFNDLRNQGYDFASAQKAIENQNVNKTLSERMKELVLSGHISSYSGEAGFKEEVEKVMHKKALVIEELMQKLTGELEEYSIELTRLERINRHAKHH